MQLLDEGVTVHVMNDDNDGKEIVESEKSMKETHPEFFDENGKFVKGNSAGVKFGEGQQRNGEKISRSLKAYWDRRKFREQLFKEITETEIDIGNGKKINFVKAFLDRFKFAMLAKDDEVIAAGFEPLTLNERFYQFFKLIEKLTPEERNVRLTSDMPVNITFKDNDKNLI